MTRPLPALLFYFLSSREETRAPNMCGRTDGQERLQLRRMHVQPANQARIYGWIRGSTPHGDVMDGPCSANPEFRSSMETTHNPDY